LEASFACIVHQFFEAGGYFVIDPIGATLSTNQGWNVPHLNHAKPEFGSEGSYSCSLASTTKGADIRAIFLHDFLLVRKSDSKYSRVGS
jgi:hypothetical protein